MPSTPSSIFRLELMANGENDTTWGTKTNTNLQLVEQGAAQWLNIDVTGTGDYTLTNTNYTTDEARNFSLNLYGTLSGDRTIIAPAVGKPYIVVNNTTGSYSLSIKPTGGTALTIPQGYAMLVAINTSTAVAAVNAVPGAFRVSGATTLIGTLQAASSVSVGGSANITGAIDVGGSATFASNLRVSGTAWTVPVTVEWATSCSINFAQGNNFVVSVSGTGTLAAPANAKPGQAGTIWLYTASAGVSVTFPSSTWKFSGGTRPTITGTAGAIDILGYVVRADASAIDANLLTDMS